MQSELHRIARANQLKFRQPRRKIEQWLLERDIGPIQSDIWIYTEYPWGWVGVVAAWNRLWIFRDHRGNFMVVDVQHIQGLNKNGTLKFEWVPSYDSDFIRRN